MYLVWFVYNNYPSHSILWPQGLLVTQLLPEACLCIPSSTISLLPCVLLDFWPSTQQHPSQCVLGHRQSLQLLLVRPLSTPTSQRTPSQWHSHMPLSSISRVSDRPPLPLPSSLSHYSSVHSSPILGFIVWHKKKLFCHFSLVAQFHTIGTDDTYIKLLHSSIHWTWRHLHHKDCLIRQGYWLFQLFSLSLCMCVACYLNCI